MHLITKAAPLQIIFVAQDVQIDTQETIEMYHHARQHRFCGFFRVEPRSICSSVLRMVGILRTFRHFHMSIIVPGLVCPTTFASNDHQILIWRQAHEKYHHLNPEVESDTLHQQIVISAQEMANFASKSLFGGAISVDLPPNFIDVR
jgi:hypothetical protein